MGTMRVDEASLTAVADAIREKAGSSEGLIFPEGFVSAVAGIQAGGGVKVQVGTFIKNSDFAYSSLSLQHDLGVSPNYFAWWRKEFAEDYQTASSGGYYGTIIDAEDVVAGFYFNGISAYVKGYENYATSDFRYHVFPKNADNYGRVVYKMTATNIYSGMGAFGARNSAECFWIAAAL